MDILGQSAVLVAVTSFALGFSVGVRNVRNKLFLAFAGLSTVIALWALCFFLERVQGDGSFYRLHLLCNVWLGPAALAFIRVLVRIQNRLSRRLLDLSVLLALAATVALGFHYESVDWIRQVIYFAPGVIVIQIAQLMWIDRRIRLGVKLLPKLPTVGIARRNLIYLGALLVLSTCVMDHVPFMGRIIPTLGNLALCVYLFFISQAITQQRLLNFSALISRFVVLMVLALALTGIYVLLVGWVNNSPGLFFLNSFIASFAILMMADPLRAVVRFLTARLLTKEHRRLEQALREAQQRLAGIVDPGSLFQAVLLVCEQTLQPQWLALFTLRSDGVAFRRIRSSGQEPELPSGHPPVREVLLDHVLVQYCIRLKRRGELPILLDQILESEIDRSASRTQRESLEGVIQALKAMGCNLLVPLFEDFRVLGFVTMRAPAPPEPWGNNWGILPVLYPYFEQASQSLRGMEVYTRQREKERLAAIGEMAAGLAHEIRNPLGAIKGAAQYLDPSSDRPESRFLQVIVEETDRLNRVVTQFLDYSKPHAPELGPVDVSDLVERTVELLKPSTAERVSLMFQTLAPETRAMAQPEQIRQVLINLIQNSFKALESKGRGTVVVRVEKPGSRELAIVVEDDGPGIRRENLEKLFIPFFTTSPSGTGLGLSICQKIIEAHGGRIDVASEEGRFARFTVVLPELELQADSQADPRTSV